MLTEAQMGRRFRSVLKAGDKPLMAFTAVDAEVDFTQGRPDFVGVNGAKRGKRTLPGIYAGTRIPVSHIARVLTVLERDQTISLIDLAQAAAVTLPRTRRIVHPLERIGAVCADAEETLRVVDLDRIERPDLWAFELKLDDWKRCLFQTMVCRSYASRVTAIFPKAKANHIKQVAPAFAQHGVGVMLFDADTDKLKPLVPTAARKPMSAYHAWMSCFEIANA
jgi:hypothetical protein